MKSFDALCIGNALIDILVEVPDQVIQDLELTKGRQHALSEQQSKAVLEKIKFTHAKLTAGGGASNAIALLAQLGAKTIFYGSVGDDEYGIQYEKETKAAGVYARLHKSRTITGHVAVLITPDAERTLAVNLGASVLLKKEHIIEADIAASNIIHLDGYLIEQAPEICKHALALAKKHQVQVSIDASDPGIIQRNRQQFIDMIRTYSPILFANEQEAKELTGKEPEAAARELAAHAKIAVVKCGSNGSIIAERNNLIKIAAAKAQAVDTTGAGDAYAGGFLYGCIKNWPLSKSGKLASTLAAKVVEQIGARLERIPQSATEIVNDSTSI